MNNVLVSIVIPVFNAGEYLEMCLNSLLRQTHQNIELLIIDDGSTDNSYKIVEYFKNKDLRINYTYQKNQGVSIARNVGILKAKGEFIMFVDPDDYLSNDAVNTLLQLVVREKSDIAISDFIYKFPDRSKEASHFPSTKNFNSSKDIKRIQLQLLSKKISGLKGNLGDRIGAPWAKIYRAKLIKQNNLLFEPKLSNSEDVVFNLYAMNFAKKISYVKMPLYFYRINNNSLTSKYNPNIELEIKKYLSCIEIFICKFYPKDKEFLEAFNVKTSSSIYKCLYMYYLHDENFMNSKDKKNEIKQLLEQEPFKRSLKSVKTKNMTIEEKILFFCVKNRMFKSIKTLLIIRNSLK